LYSTAFQESFTNNSNSCSYVRFLLHIELELLSSQFLIFRKKKSKSKNHLNQTPIYKELYKNQYHSFAGLGRHLINDFLYFAGIHPYTPSSKICDNNESFEAFTQQLIDYFHTFTSKKFLQLVATASNIDNPLGFNENSNRNYMGGWVHVYRRSITSVPATLYNSYASQGLFDSDHIIGEYVICSKRLF
jgi:formamidopyrimidine-DNA glycosylase